MNLSPPASSCGTFFAVPFARVGDSSSGEIALERNDQQHSLRVATAVAESPPRGDASDTNYQPPPAAGYKCTLASGEHRTGNNGTVSGGERRPRCYSSPAADPSEGRWRKCEGGVRDSPAFTGDLTGTWSRQQFLRCGRSTGTGPCLLPSRLTPPRCLAAECLSYFRYRMFKRDACVRWCWPTDSRDHAGLGHVP